MIQRTKNEDIMVSSSPLNRLAKVLIGEITSYLNAKEVHRFLSTSNLLFGDVKYEFLQLFVSLDPDDFIGDWSESEGIRSKIKDTFRQLKVSLILPEQLTSTDMENVLSLPSCALIKVQLSENPVIEDWVQDIRKHNEVHLLGVNDDITSFDFLLSQNENLPRCLEKLQLKAFEELRDVSALSHLSEVTLVSCPFVVDVSCLKNVRRLTLRNLPFLKEVNGLGNVYDLTLDIIDPLEDISGLTNNYRLSVTNCPEIKEYQSLFNAKHLTTDVFPPQVFQDDHCHFQKVKRLSVVRIQNEVISKTSFSHLHEFHLINCRELKVLNGVYSIPVVRIAGCDKLHDISCIGGNKIVKLKSCDAIEDFSSLRGIPEVQIKSCLKLKDATPLAESKTVSLEACLNLKDVSMLGNVDHLELIGFCEITSFDGLGKVRVLKLTVQSFHPNIKSMLSLQDNEKLILAENLYDVFITEDPIRAKKYHVEVQDFNPFQHIYTLLRERR